VPWSKMDDVIRKRFREWRRHPGIGAVPNPLHPGAMIECREGLKILMTGEAPVDVFQELPIPSSGALAECQVLQLPFRRTLALICLTTLIREDGLPWFFILLFPIVSHKLPAVSRQGHAPTGFARIDKCPTFH